MGKPGRMEFVHDGAVCRFWLGEGPTEYIDVTPYGDLQDGQWKLELLGGQPGMVVEPQSGNVVRVGQKVRRQGNGG